MNKLPYPHNRIKTAAFNVVAIACFLFSSNLFSQEVKIQQVQDDILEDGSSVGPFTSFTAVSDINKAFALPLNNRKTHAGRSDLYSATNLQGHDMAGARVLTGTGTLTYYREPGSDSDTDGMNFQTAIWEYTGLLGGNNEFIVRGRYAVSMDASNTSDVDITSSGIGYLTTVVNANKCIPFITGFLNDDTTRGSANATAITYLDSPTNLVVSRGGPYGSLDINGDPYEAPSVTVFITLVEFTGANWKVLHGRNLTNDAQDTGNITLYDGYDGTSFTGVPYSVFDWTNAIIFSQSYATSANDHNNKHHTRSQWPLMTPASSGDQTVDWTFADQRTTGNNKNRHFVHVLDNPQVTVTRIDDNTLAVGENTIDITSANLSALDESLIIGATISNGTTSYGQGWRNYYIIDDGLPLDEAAHWGHRAGSDPGTPDANNFQIIDFSNLTDTPVQREGPGGLTENLQLWLKADEGIEKTGSNVTKWNGNTTLDNYADPYAGTPVFNENTFNFNPEIYVDGTDRMFMNANITGNDSITVFAVAEGQYGSQNHLVNLRKDNNNYLIVEMNASATIRGRYVTSGSTTKDATTAVTEQVPFLLGYEHIATGVSSSNQLYNNGVVSNSAASSESHTLTGNLEVGIGTHRRTTTTTKNWEGGIAEIVVFNKKLTTVERDQVESYLAIKYGFTLGVNGTSQDYLDTDGRVIWDSSDNSGYNTNVTGLGRDDKSGLDQKQSKSNLTDDDITVGIKEIATTNALNSNLFFSNKTFLTWGHDNGAITAGTDITKDFGAATGVLTNATATPIVRIWKMVVTDSVPTVKLSIPKTLVSATNPGDADKYIMIISDNAAFTTNVTSATMEIVGLNLEVDFYFEGTKYVTFGSAEEVAIGDRSVYFNNSGTTDTYLDAGDVNDLDNTSFTISAWVKRDTGENKFDVVSKRDYFDENDATNNLGGFSYGYAFRINQLGEFRMVWKNHGDSENNQLQTTAVQIPENEWHQIAASYDMGTNMNKLYIDGVLIDSDDTLDPMVASTDAHFMIGAAHHIKRQQKVRGSIDEVRVWDVALTGDQIRYIMNQEIEEDGSNFAAGKILPPSTTKNEIVTIPWNNLIAYYPMSTTVFGSIKDESNSGNDASMINYDNLDAQTAPLPYKTTLDGDWDDSTTWLNGNVQYLPGVVSYLYEDDADADKQTMDYNIVQIDHDITMDNSLLDADGDLYIPAYKNGNRTVLGLLIDSDKELQIDGNTATNTGYGLTVSHYLKIDGTLDLEGESQLIQTEDSDIDPASTGRLERDQQGVQDLYTYNYWASPVRPDLGSTSYKVPDILNDGTDIKTTPSELPDGISFLTSGYDGNTGSPLSIADYWIWKFDDRTSNAYSQWQHVRSTEDLQVGEGFTMKGVSFTPGDITDEQNYVFSGKPNNGDITLEINPGRDYLVGNPYPSALDADLFIKDHIDNTGDGSESGNNAINVINGALYFWEHFASQSHYLADYQGGYGVYTLMGGAKAINNDTRIDNDGTEGIKTPQRYIPVGQGFFVSSVLDAANFNLTNPVVGGDLVFTNSQRIFEKEGASSIFFRSAEGTNASTANSDTRQKIRIMFDSPDGYHRQLLVGVDPNASNNFDIGYDAPLNETNKEDMYWQFSSEKLVIQAVNNFDEDQILPLGVKTDIEGLSTVRIDELENIASEINIYVYDNETNISHDLRVGNFEIQLAPGIHEGRLSLVFRTQESLSVEDEEILKDSLTVVMNNAASEIQIRNNGDAVVEKVILYNILGQPMNTWSEDNFKTEINLPVSKLTTGVYIINIQTDRGMLTKKVIIE